MLEWYDFTVYALFAIYIGRNFFPAADAGANLLKAFIAFGVGFVVRPLGAILIGHYGDRAGRKAALTLTIALMAGGTAIIALAPPFAAIGVGAPMLLLVGRVLQGFSAGGEVGAATAFLLESAKEEERGAMASWLEASMGLSNILGALTALLVSTLATAEQANAWGWRAPFIFGLLIAPVGVYLRRVLAETPEFRAEAERRQRVTNSSAPLREVFQKHRRALTSGFGLSVLWAVAVYVLIVYTPVYVQVTFNFTAAQAFAASLIGNVFFVAACPLSGALSDRIGRRRMLLVSSLLLFAGVLPLLRWLQADPNVGTLILVQTAFCILVAAFVGVAPAGLAEMFPTGVRSTAVSVVYNAAFTLFGGFAPSILTWFSQRAGASVFAPAWYVTLAAAVALVAISLTNTSTQPAAVQRLY